MEYPGSLFTRPWRRGILVTFIAIFAVVTPILLLYTIGYRFDPGHGFLKKTGALSISALPKTASVYVNGQTLGKKIPVRLSAISPNQYRVKISEAGYHDWEKEVEVKDRQTTYVKDIELIKKTEPKLVESGNVSNLSLSPYGTFLIYSIHTTSTSRLILLNTKTNESTEILKQSLLSTITAEWSFDQNFVLLKINDQPTISFIIVSLHHPESLILLGNILSDQTLIKAAWRRTAIPELYYETNRHELYSFNAITKVSIFVKNLDTVQDWIVHADEVWVLTQNPTTKGLEVVKNFLIAPQVIATLNQPEIIQAPLHEWRIAGMEGTTIALQRVGDEKLVLYQGNEIFTIPATKFIISPYENWWLFSNSFELWSYREDDVPQLLTRSSEKLNSVVPLDEFNTLLLSWQNKSTVLFPYYFVTHDFLAYSFSEIAADHQNRTLYTAGKIDKQDGLWKIEY